VRAEIFKLVTRSLRNIRIIQIIERVHQVIKHFTSRDARASATEPRSCGPRTSKRS